MLFLFGINLFSWYAVGGIFCTRCCFNGRRDVEDIITGEVKQLGLLTTLVFVIALNQLLNTKPSDYWWNEW